MKTSIEKIRARVRGEKYTISSHANEEMSDDELTAQDLEQAILSGKIRKTFTKDPRGRRYEIVGPALDGRPVSIVCRMLGGGWLRVITVYTLASEEI